VKALYLKKNFDVESFKNQDQSLAREIINNITLQGNRCSELIHNDGNVKELLDFPSYVTGEEIKKKEIGRCVVLYNTLSKLLLYSTQEELQYIKSTFKLKDEQTKWFTHYGKLTDIIEKEENKGYFFPISFTLSIADIYLKSKFINSMIEMLFPNFIYNNRVTNPIVKSNNLLRRNINNRNEGNEFKTELERELIENEDFNNLQFREMNNLFIEKIDFTMNDFISGVTERKLLKPFFRQTPLIFDEHNCNTEGINRVKFSLLRQLTQDYTFKDEDAFTESKHYTSSISYSSYISKKLNSYLK
jgi:hypothetical protein